MPSPSNHISKQFLSLCHSIGYSAGGGRWGLDSGVLFMPLAASLVHLNEKIFHVLNLALHRLRLVPKLPVPPLQPMKLLLQAVELRPLALSIPAEQNREGAQLIERPFPY